MSELARKTDRTAHPSLNTQSVRGLIYSSLSTRGRVHSADRGKTKSREGADGWVSGGHRFLSFGSSRRAEENPTETNQQFLVRVTRWLVCGACHPVSGAVERSARPAGQAAGVLFWVLGFLVFDPHPTGL